jgi:phenylacetate-CoA ligase
MTEYFNRKIETSSTKSLRVIQEKKLRAEIAYVYKNSVFYKGKFKKAGIHPNDIKTIDDLQKIPFTTKEEIRDNQLKAPPLGLHACAPPDKVIRIHSSSGTTGRPSYIGITLHDREVWTQITARSLYAENIRKGDKVVHAAGLSFFVGGLPVHDAIEEIGATFIPIGTGASDRVISSIQNIRANALHSTPSYAMYLANYVREKLNMEPKELHLSKIVGGAEPGIGIPSIRKKIEDDWGAEAREGMGNADMAPIIFGECFAREGMHFCGQEYIICELIDPETGENMELKEGAEGELVYTAIDRECVPLIRFRTRDRIVVWTDKCECGRTSFRQRCIGRTDDMLIVLGVNVFPSAVRDVVASLRPKTTGEIKIILSKPGPAVEPPVKIKAEYAKEFKGNLDELKNEVEDALREKLIFRASVELVPEGTLPRYEMKAKLVEVVN